MDWLKLRLTFWHRLEIWTWPVEGEPMYRFRGVLYPIRNVAMIHRERAIHEYRVRLSQ